MFLAQIKILICSYSKSIKCEIVQTNEPKLSNVPNNDDKLDKGKYENIHHYNCESTIVFLVQPECRINKRKIQKIQKIQTFN